jgi:hypothetical protein
MNYIIKATFKRSGITLFLLLLSIIAKSQMIYIPDTAFQNWIKLEAPGAMTGDSLDTTHPAVLNDTSASIFNNNNITTISGIEYFVNLKYLDLNGVNNLTSLNALPPDLVDFTIYNCGNFSSLTAVLPVSLTSLTIQVTQLTTLPSLPPNLKDFICANSNLASLGSIPNSVVRMNLSMNFSFANLPFLPSSIETLNVGGCAITSIPFFPGTLKFLRMDGNQCSIPNWPPALEELHASVCNISNLPSIISPLKILDIQNNNITCLPTLPNTLQTIAASGNPVTCLPNLPSSLTSSDIGFDLCNNLTLTSTSTTSCFSNCDAVVTVNFTSGNYNYSWYNGQTGSIVNNSSAVMDSLCSTNAGSFTLTPSSGGCPSKLLFTISQPIALNCTSTTHTDVTCSGTIDGTITAGVQNGVPPYLYSLDGGVTTQTSPLFQNLDTGAYDVTVIDLNGCTGTAHVIIAHAPDPIVNLGPDFTVCPLSTVALCANSAAGITYFWSNGSVTQCIFATVGVYSVIVADQNGCTGSDVVVITPINPPLGLSVDSIQLPDCGLCNGAATINVDSAGGPFSYIWTSGGITTPSFQGICSDSIYKVIVQDINGCVDSISFTLSCADVWPGDANYDGIADNNDLLDIGIGYGISGPTRQNATITWQPEAGINWTDTLLNSINYKHIDCNGDGTIADDDTIAIIQNYSLTHPLRPQNNAGPNDPTLFFDITVDTASCGSHISIPLVLGTAAVPAVDIYGIAFTINYDTALVKADSVSMDFSNCWIPGSGHYLSIAVNDPSNGRLYAAVTRTDHTDTTGYGNVGTFGIVTVDNISARLSGIAIDTLILAISDVHLIAHTGESRLVNFGSDSLIINDNTVSVNQYNRENSISIYPNPAGDYFIINAENTANAEVSIYTALNNPVPVSYKNNSNAIIVNSSELKSGLYIVKIKTDKKITFGKVMIN